MAESPSLEIQDLVLATLKANTAVMALVHGVWDTPPTDPWGTEKAYITFGAEDMTPDDAECITGETHTLQLDVWSRSVGYPACKEICAAVKKALHGQPLGLTDNALVSCELVLLRIFRDPDGVTTHGAMQFEFRVEVPDD